MTVNDVTPGSFWLSFGSFAKMVDVWFAMAKTITFAGFVAVISSLRGMEAKGGPRGVADAVNAAVVLNVVCIVTVNLAITQLETMFFRWRWHSGSAIEISRLAGGVDRTA